MSTFCLGVLIPAAPRRQHDWTIQPEFLKISSPADFIGGLSIHFRSKTSCSRFVLSVCCQICAQVPVYRSKGALHERNHKHRRKQLVCVPSCLLFSLSSLFFFSLTTFLLFFLASYTLLVEFQNTTTPFLPVVWKTSS